jgi:maleylpyruvate isomerase
VKPVDAIAGCRAAHRALLRTVDGVDEATLRRPSALPGWTVAHVVAHLARNADSHVRRFEGCVRDEVVDQYPGGYEARAAEIEVGAQQPARALVADLRASCAAFEASCDAMPDDAWARLTRDVGGRERPASALVARRWQEVEVHHVDLALGYGFGEWPDPFVADCLPRMLAGLPDRLPAGAPRPTFDGVDDRTVLAWLFDRVDLPRMPELVPIG